MTEDHRHDPATGEVVLVSEPAPVVSDAEVIAAAEVQKAEIESATAIQLAKIEAKQVEPDLEAQLAAALDELATLRAMVTPPEPEPAEPPEPIVIQDNAPAEDEPDMTPPEADHDEPRERKKSRGIGAW